MLGRLGPDVGYARVNDGLRVVVMLSEPAFAYLLALNPDQTIQLCLPEDDAEPPPRSARLMLHPDTSTYFTLTEGAGVQAFAVVASRSPMPAYRDWYSQRGLMPWTQMESTGVWRFDGAHVIPITTPRAGAEPGGDEPGLTTLRVPEPFAKTCRAFRRLADVDAVAGICFPVRPELDAHPNP
jgi:hypothetical protein